MLFPPNVQYTAYSLYQLRLLSAIQCEEDTQITIRPLDLRCAIVQLLRILVSMMCLLFASLSCIETHCIFLIDLECILCNNHCSFILSQF